MSCRRRTGRCGSQIGGDRQAVRLAPALQLEALAELLAGLLHRHPLAVGRRARGVDLPHPAQHALGLRLRESVSAALGADGADLALDAPAVRPVPRREPRAADHPQRAGAVGPSTSARERRSCDHPAEALRVRHVPFMYHFDRIVPDRADRKCPVNQAYSDLVRSSDSGWGPGGRRFKSCLPD